MSSKGFLESLMDSFSLWAAVQNSKDHHGKPDPYKAAGIAYGMRGNLSTADILELGGYLGAEGAFVSNGSMDSTDDDYYGSKPNFVSERQSMDWNAVSQEEKAASNSKSAAYKSRISILEGTLEMQSTRRQSANCGIGRSCVERGR